MKIRKYLFNNEHPKLELPNQEKLFLMTSVIQLKIDLIEIETNDPNDLVFIISGNRNGANFIYNIYLYKYRSKMIYQNGKYILDTQNIEDFKISTDSTEFEILVHSEDSSIFNLTAYHSFELRV